MSRTDPLLRVRVPVDLKGWLEREALRNLRSMNAEIVVSIRERMEKAQPATGESLQANAPAAGSDDTALAGGPAT